MIKAIGFDFDGTLIMSEKQKAHEMAEVFKESFGITSGVKSQYQKLRGLSREQKVERLFHHFFDRKHTKKELKAVHDHFGKHYERSLRTCPLFECTNVIKELKKQVDYLFLLSVENRREVRKVANHCGVGKYFDEILGGPKSKVENLKHVVKKHRLKSSEVLYIGDSFSDVVASNKMKVKVVLLKKTFRYKDLIKSLEANFVFSSLCDLPTSLEKFH